MKINGERFYLWRAVDHEGEVLGCSRNFPVITPRYTTVKSQIEAYAPDGTKMTIVMDNQSGSSLSEQTLTGTSSDFSSIASSIAAVYSEQSNDNNESYSGGSNDGGNDSHSSGNDNDSNESYSSGNDNDSNDNDSDGHDSDSNDSDGHDDGGDDND